MLALISSGGVGLWACRRHRTWPPWKTIQWPLLFNCISLLCCLKLYKMEKSHIFVIRKYSRHYCEELLLLDKHNTSFVLHISAYFSNIFFLNCCSDWNVLWAADICCSKDRCRFLLDVVRILHKAYMCVCDIVCVFSTMLFFVRVPTLASSGPLFCQGVWVTLSF